jgi:hypothetical protein
MSDPVDIESLFDETEVAFNNAPIKKYAAEKNLAWHYSISSTRIIPNSTLLIGFNWGAEVDYRYTPQEVIPENTFKDLHNKRELGSFQRVYESLKKYLPVEDIDNCVQTNFCFFRSKNESQITQEDLDLSTPLFLKLIQIVQPKRIIGFSSKLLDYCIIQKLCTVEAGSFASNKRTLHVGKDFFTALKNKYRFTSCPTQMRNLPKQHGKKD